VSGREAGERLELTRNEAGDVVFMRWATYRFTRHQETFAEAAADAGTPPGGAGFPEPGKGYPS
jgi:hypothetical protein